jgi:hypothetical protein
MSHYSRMLVSAEIRWFWEGSLPAGLESWFHGGAWPPGGGRPRVDEYLVSTGTMELGIKKRGADSGVEIKGLVDVRAALPAPFAAQVEIWSKWTSPALTIDHVARVRVRKTRRVRKYDTTGTDVIERRLGEDERPLDASALVRGCQMELVAVEAAGFAARWWTLGFEAFGALADIESDLMRTAAHLASTAPPALAGGLALSYPAWLDLLRTRRKAL